MTKPFMKDNTDPQRIVASEFLDTHDEVEVWYELKEEDVEPFIWAYGTSFPVQRQFRHERPLPHVVDHMAKAAGFPVRKQSIAVSRRTVDVTLPKVLPVDAAGAPCPVGGIEETFIIPTARKVGNEALSAEVLEEIDRKSRRFKAISKFKILRLTDVCPKVPNLTADCHWGALVHEEWKEPSAVWAGQFGLTRSDSGHSIHIAKTGHPELEGSVIFFAQFPRGWGQFWGLDTARVTRYRLQLSYYHYLDPELVWQFRL